MPKAKSKKNKKAKLNKSREEIMDLSMAYLAENGLGLSLKELCKPINVKKSQFEAEFESIENFEKFVWSELMRLSIQTTISDAQFNSFSKREKLLTLYYTFFENCGFNNSFLNASIDHHGHAGMLSVLKFLKAEFVPFVNSLHHMVIPIGKQYGESINKLSNVAIGEAFYGQLLLLLEFWSNDKSVDFEKTDVAIEKTVRASMDILDVTPVKSVIDLAKFFWQERISKGS